MIPLDDIRRAADVLQDRVIRTPLIYSPTFSTMTGAHVYLKLENLQKTGSFKLRGATYKIESCRDQIGAQGVVAASAGNHAQGVALAATEAGFLSTIFMPEWASISKQEATRSYGGEVILAGQSLAESLQRALDLARTGKTFIHPFDDPDVISGQATIGLEILEDLPDPDLILVPIGGGGLAAGIASSIKALRPQTRIIGVQAAACPSAYEACHMRNRTRVKPRRSIADGISVKQVGELTFPIICEQLDDIVLVVEEQIAAAILLLLERKKILAEGAGAVPLAAILSASVEVPRDSKVVLVISGGNVDIPLLGRILAQGLLRNGRIMRFTVQLDDIPGSLSRLLALIAALQANVMHIYHHRGARDLPINVTRVQLELETRSARHISRITDELEKAGYHIELI